MSSECDYDKALDRGLRLLTTRPYTQWGLRDRLLRMGYPGEVVEKVVSRLAELSILDDPAFAELWVEGARDRGVAARLMKARLESKGIPKEAIERVLDGHTARVEVRRAIELAQRRIRAYGGLSVQVASGRLARFLLGKGYEEEVVAEVLRRVLGDPGTEP